MLVSPLIDLLVIAGSGFLALGSLLKFIDVVTRYNPAILGFSSLDFLLMCGVCWGACLVLAARTWVRLNEPKLVDLRRRQTQEEARRRIRDVSGRADASDGDEKPVVVRAAGADPS